MKKDSSAKKRPGSGPERSGAGQDGIGQNGPEKIPASRTMEDVAQYIRRMRFKKRLFGGVDEADVFRQMELLHREYEAVFLSQALKYEALLEKARGASEGSGADAAGRGAFEGDVATEDSEAARE